MSGYMRRKSRPTDIIRPRASERPSSEIQVEWKAAIEHHMEVWRERTHQEAPREA